jgi:hypothetical protein
MNPAMLQGPAPASQPQPASPAQSQGRAILTLLLQASALLGTFWLLFFALSLKFQYLRNGADLIYEVKAEAIRHRPLLDHAKPCRVLIFGSSKVLAGFVPDLFDSLSGATVSSYNLGLPNGKFFLGDLERLCQRGQNPTHVLVPDTWADEPQPSFSIFRLGVEDRRVVNTLFPFRWLPRDLSLFLIRAWNYGGLRAFYAHSRRQPQKMLEQRGYYFIEGESHFPGHRLPEGFRLETDTPNQIRPRAVPTDGPTFQRLAALAQRYDFKVILVPLHFRQGEYAAPPQVSQSAQALAGQPRFSAVGPDYYLLPNRYFSDEAHLNPEGASLYTRRLWELVAPSLAPPKTAVQTVARRPS